MSHLMFADDLLLFAEANLDQIEVIKAVVGRFCEASGQKVNNSKTTIYFSKNVSHDEKHQIAGVGGFRTTSNIGKYLGIPIVHGRLRASTLQEIINKLSLQLSS